MRDTSRPFAHPLRNSRLLFIGGAPRSGTSMLVRAFDWHPGVLMFPFELGAIQKMCRGSKDDLLWYLETEALAPFSKTGRLAHAEALLRLVLDLERNFRGTGTRRLRCVDSEAYRDSYRRYLAESDEPVEVRGLKALCAGILGSSDDLASRWPQPRYVAFKVPYLVEYFARDLAKHFEGAHFLHIVREPIGRYMSAKLRYIKPLDSAAGLPPINGKDFVTAQAEIEVSSQHLGEINREELGERYRVVYYDELQLGRESAFRSICEWLSIEWNDSLMEQSLFGDYQPLPSSLGHLNEPGLETAGTRRDALEIHTSRNERELLRYLCSQYRPFGGALEMVPSDAPDHTLWNLPYRYETAQQTMDRVKQDNPLQADPTSLRQSLRTRVLSLIETREIRFF